MKKLALLLFALLPLGMSAKNYEIRVDRAIESIVNSSEADVELIYSPTAAGKIIYSSPEVEAPLRITVSRAGKLSIETTRKKNYKVSKVKVYHSGKISEIVNSGTGDVETSAVNSPIELKLVNSGTGDIEITEVNVKKINIVNSGTGDVDLDGGKTIALKIANSGTGDVKAKVKSSTAEIVNSGTGDVTGVRQSSTSMKLSNPGIGKITIKKQSDGGGDISFTPGTERNIRFIR